MLTDPVCQVCGGKCCIGCKKHTESGCSLPYQERPLSCQLYPFVKLTDGDLVLNLSCPYWRSFIDYYPEARELVA